VLSSTDSRNREDPGSVSTLSPPSTRIAKPTDTRMPSSTPLQIPGTHGCHQGQSCWTSLCGVPLRDFLEGWGNL